MPVKDDSKGIIDKTLALPFQKRKQLEQNLEYITQQMYARNKELADTNRMLSLLRTIDTLVLESHASLKKVCDDISEAIGTAMQYPYIGIFTRTARSESLVRLYGWSARTSDGKVIPSMGEAPIHLDLAQPLFVEMRGSQVLEPGNFPVEQIALLMHSTPQEVERMLKAMPLKSVYVVKLVVRRKVVGVVMVGSYGDASQFKASEIQLLDRLSESIGVALDNKLLFEENQRQLRQLRELNTKLKALDEAKDDFVSMASHQLRTPLTSVKGYISMVLEGDAGEVTELQNKLLTQAFFSSQRMVYLIADLLNVSRLKTGKFIIDASPIDLVEVVEQEVAQLQDTAKAHSLTLTYEKPKDAVPRMMLDETKTRQVIMNFIDNAIYYTPSGGNIVVKLAVSPATVELRVKDDGIGVPKSEQAHLFTKFYRAGNARKARPDGTGLGLFMAKKVIVSQGGTLLFESKEGKGSTFGFILSRAKLEAPENEPAAVSDQAPEPKAK